MVFRLLIASLLTIAACGSESQIAFRICGKLDVPEQIDALRISILDEKLTEQSFALIELTARKMVAEGGIGDSATPDDEQSDPRNTEAEDAADGGDESKDRSATTKSLPVIGSLKARSGSGYVRVQALLEGVEVARFDRQVPDLEGVSTVDMPLTEKCYGRYNCALGQTCVKGDCVVAPMATDPPTCD
jgi:hypothetical protein